MASPIRAFPTRFSLKLSFPAPRVKTSGALTRSVPLSSVLQCFLWALLPYGKAERGGVDSSKVRLISIKVPLGTKASIDDI